MNHYLYTCTETRDSSTRTPTNPHAACPTKRGSCGAIPTEMQLWEQIPGYDSDAEAFGIAELGLSSSLRHSLQGRFFPDRHSLGETAAVGKPDVAVGQNQWYHFGVGVLVYFSGDWDVRCRYGILTHGLWSKGGIHRV